ncbi:hypothetical protein [Streptomyces sp. NPDC012510]|uniref:hypothetical protein n=1 Tax=Streptomyces sp. NPDC012510 TaxID=3364838 RepID=UPI0036E67BB4
MVIAAQAQMDQQDRVRKIFEPFEKARVEAEEQAGIGIWAGDDIEPTTEEQAEIDTILVRRRRPVLDSDANHSSSRARSSPNSLRTTSSNCW